jgi:hypothetical protein
MTGSRIETADGDLRHSMMSAWYKAARCAALCAAAVLASIEASAHDLEYTRVTATFHVDGSIQIDVSNNPDWLLLRLAPFAGVTMTGPLTPSQRDAQLSSLADVFSERVVVFIDEAQVRMIAEYVPPDPRAAAGTAPGTVPIATMRLRGIVPPEARSFQWLYALVIDPYPLTVRYANGEVATHWVMGDAWSEPVDLSGTFSVSRWHTARQYLGLGFAHILPRGIDHVLFVLGVFLLNIRLRPVLLQVTAFTVAHSITLGLTIYGIVSLPSSIVEPLIALSIAYVAVENLLTSELQPWRVALVFAFGLLHGMGFAGVLSELGLPRSEFVTALVTFNVGVEAGQLTVIALAFAIVGGYRQKDWYRRRVVIPVSLTIAATGMYWTFARLNG